jgi:hypothetical protein
MVETGSIAREPSENAMKNQRETRAGALLPDAAANAPERPT